MPPTQGPNSLQVCTRAFNSQGSKPDVLTHCGSSQRARSRILPSFVGFWVSKPGVSFVFSAPRALNTKILHTFDARRARTLPVFRILEAPKAQNLYFWSSWDSDHRDFTVFWRLQGSTPRDFTLFWSSEASPPRYFMCFWRSRAQFLELLCAFAFL